MSQNRREQQPEVQVFGPAEIGALAHLYRGEVYRSTVWRTRLDHTTNWAVVTLGIALSIAFSSKDASPLPLVLVGILIFAFLGFEARRYRYFNVWRARARWIETHFYAPMLRGEDDSRQLAAGARGRLLRARVSHQLRSGARAPATSQLCLDFRDPGHRLLRQDCRASDSNGDLGAPVGTHRRRAPSGRADGGLRRPVLRRARRLGCHHVSSRPDQTQGPPRPRSHGMSPST